MTKAEFLADPHGRAGVALVCRLAVPRRRLGEVLRHGLPVGIHEAEAALRDGDALLRREAMPPDGLHVVLQDALAGGVHFPEIKLRIHVPLVRGLAKGSNVILGYVFSDAVRR